MQQHCLIAVLKGYLTWDYTKASWSTWVTTVSNRVLIDHFRKYARRSKLEDAIRYGIKEFGEDPENDWSEIEAGMRQLTRMQREVLALRLGIGGRPHLSAKNIAIKLGRSVSRVRDAEAMAQVRLAQILVRMRETGNRGVVDTVAEYRRRLSDDARRERESLLRMARLAGGHDGEETREEESLGD